MSLNRSEQMLYDYVQHHGEERQFWKGKVRGIVNDSIETASAINRIDSDLWRYFEERSGVVPALVDARRAYGSKRTSMKNLAEHFVRIWTEPRPRKPAPQVEP